MIYAYEYWSMILKGKTEALGVKAKYSEGNESHCYSTGIGRRWEAGDEPPDPHHGQQSCRHWKSVTLYANMDFINKSVQQAMTVNYLLLPPVCFSVVALDISSSNFFLFYMTKKIITYVYPVTVTSLRTCQGTWRISEDCNIHILFSSISSFPIYVVLVNIPPLNDFGFLSKRYRDMNFSRVVIYSLSSFVSLLFLAWMSHFWINEINT